MRVAVVTNPHAGPSKHPTGAEIRAALEGAGVECTVCDGEGSELKDVIERALAASPDAVIASGGDGTVSAVAGALVGREIAMGVVPSGTLNHFAKDLNIPLDLAGAVRVIVGGGVRAVDIGEVNGHTFI